MYVHDVHVWEVQTNVYFTSCMYVHVHVVCHKAFGQPLYM